MQDIIFKKKIVETIGPEKKVFHPVDLGDVKKDGTVFTPLDLSAKQVAFTPIDLAAPIISAVADKAVEAVSNGLKGFRISKLPSHPEDFASAWFYGNCSEISPDNITIEFNAYLQTLNELKQNKIVLPNNFDGPTIAYDLDTTIMGEFREKNISYNPEDNLIHRAWFAHCAKRAIAGLRDGLFIGDDGYERKHPEIADVIERRINQVIVDSTLYGAK